MLAIIRKILIQFKNDIRSLLLVLVAPLFVLTLVYFVMADSDYVAKIAVCEVNDTFVTVLKQEFDVSTEDTIEDCKDYLETSDCDVVIKEEDGQMQIYMLEANSKTGKVTKYLEAQSKSQMEVTSFYGSDSENQMDQLSFVFLGLLSFFFVFILSGMSFVRERTSQTLERMLMSPISRRSVIGGYTLGYGIVAAVQAVIITLFSIYILKIQVVGNVILCILVMVLIAFIAVGVGAMLSIFANNELQLVQFIPIVIIPQIFFSGLIPIETIPFHLDLLRFLSPCYYGCFALHDIIVRGAGVSALLPYLCGLVFYNVILFLGNVVALKKYRRL